MVGAETLSRARALGKVVPIIAGVLLFLLCAMMFLMAAFALTGFLIMSYNPGLGSAAISVQDYLGDLAVAAFVCSLAGTVSAIQRWSVSVSVLGASLVASWGLLEIWYSLTWVADVSDIQLGVTFGTIALFVSMVAMVFVVATKEHFKPHALMRLGS